MQPLPHPEGNGTRPVSPARQPETPAPGPGRRAASAVSRWWRMGRRSMGCSGSSAAPEGTPPGPATAGCWSAAAPGLDRRHVAHAHPDLVARAIAAAIPLAVLAMLEGLKGDAGEVTRLVAQAAARNGVGTLDPAGQVPQATTVRRGDPTDQHHATGTVSPGQRALPAGPQPAAVARLGRGCRPPMPNHGPTDRPGRPAPWPRPPAVAAAAPPASCNTTAHRSRSPPHEPAPLAVAGRRRWLCFSRHPRLAPALPPPPPRRPPAGFW
jgi:hypothetical protein